MPANLLFLKVPAAKEEKNFPFSCFLATVWFSPFALSSSYFVLSPAGAGLGQRLGYIGHWNVPAPSALFVTGGRFHGNDLFSISTKRAVAGKPSESGNNTHFQRHSCPGPDFKAEKGKKGLFRPITLL